METVTLIVSYASVVASVFIVARDFWRINNAKHFELTSKETGNSVIVSSKMTMKDIRKVAQLR
jgi:hypothetical protein